MSHCPEAICERKFAYSRRACLDCLKTRPEVFNLAPARGQRVGSLVFLLVLLIFRFYNLRFIFSLSLSLFFQAVIYRSCRHLSVRLTAALRADFFLDVYLHSHLFYSVIHSFIQNIFIILSVCCGQSKWRLL